MGFRSGAYAKIWELSDVTDKSVTLRASISRKDKDSGNYVQSWSGFIKCYGEAAKAAQSAGKGGRIKLGDVDVTTKYDKEKNVTYTNYYAYSAEVAQAGLETGNKAAAQLADDFVAVPDDLGDDGLPFR